MNNREIDRLIAEKVLGFEVRYDNIVRDGKRSGIPSYSSNIEYAWLVVEKFSKVEIETGKGVNEHLVTIRDTVGWMLGYSYGETAPLAICKAALKSVGAEVKQ